MEKTIDVTAMGELLIDLIHNSFSSSGNPVFEANPGGAPANVLAMLRKYGRSCAFIGKVGNDSFGDLLVQALSETGTDVSGLLRDPAVPTTLAVVQSLPDGDRDFSFYRSPGADIMLRQEELRDDLLTGCRIFHFGSLSLTDDPCRTATFHAVRTAKDSGAIISFDPNLRTPLWNDMEEAKRMIEWGLSMSDIVKISDDEVEFVTGQTDPDLGAEALRNAYPGIRLLCITAGASGSYAFFLDKKVFMPAYTLGCTVDTTGAGDIFCASVLSFILEHSLLSLTEEDMKLMLRTANAAAYLITTRKGVIRSVPCIDEINRVILI